MRALADEKLHTMQLMVEQEQRNVDSLRQDLLSSMGLDLTSSGKKKKQASALARALETSRFYLFTNSVKRPNSNGPL